MPERIPQSATIRVPIQAYLASDHVTPATGKTIAVTISKNGAAYGNPSGGATNATEISSGSYYVDLSTTDSGTVGPLFVKGAEGTIDNVVVIYSVAKATNAGFTALPDAAANANGGLPILSSSATALAYTVTLAASGADGVVIESGINLRQAIAVGLAALAGKASGLDTNSPVYKGADNSTTRISATTDEFGNRSAVTLTPPA